VLAGDLPGFAAAPAQAPVAAKQHRQEIRDAGELTETQSDENRKLDCEIKDATVSGGIDYLITRYTGFSVAEWTLALNENAKNC
jgi:hypothetical protein